MVIGAPQLTPEEMVSWVAEDITTAAEAINVMNGMTGAGIAPGTALAALVPALAGHGKDDVLAALARRLGVTERIIALVDPDDCQP